jgi:large subunit ribosomal protein L13
MHQWLLSNLYNDMRHTIDATNEKLGRLATKIAIVLRGKDTPTFRRDTAPDIEVEVTNASRMDITTKKKDTKIYSRHTGYPGGIRTRTLGDVIRRDGYKDALRKAVRGMLPANRLRDKMLKRLTIKD